MDPAFARMLESYQLYLEARNLSAATVQTYLESLGYLGQYLVAHDLPSSLPEIQEEHIRGFISYLLAHYSESTAHNRFRAIKTFLRWCVEEGEIERSPMPRRAPHVPQKSPEVLTGEQVDQLRVACKGRGFDERRDDAIIVVLYDTGLRREELATLRVEDVDLRGKWLAVIRKGGDRDLVPIGKVAAQVLDRYARVRARHPLQARPEFWLGANGPVTGSGIYQFVRDRAAQAGVRNVHPHRFRHTSTHQHLAAGGPEGNVRTVIGWSGSSPMIR